MPSRQAHDPVSRWERFAREDPLFYLDPRLSRGVGIDEFVEQGRELVESAMGWVGELPARERALEIGCGVGRNTVHLGRHFAGVDGVDVSPTVVRIARERGLPENVRVHEVSGRDLSLFGATSFDFVFSHLVFQHIEDEPVVAGYLGETARVLRPGGAALLQFDTRPRSRLAEFVHQLPDQLLPRRHRGQMRRYRRGSAEIRRLAASGGLTVEAERGADTAEHWFHLRR
jgi:SAM-dependent methyltransferase